MNTTDATKKPRISVIKGRVFAILDGRRSTPVVNDKGEFYLSANAAGEAHKVHPTTIAFAVRKGGKATSAGHTWSRATLDQCKANGLTYDVQADVAHAKTIKAKKTKVKMRLRSPKNQTKNQKTPKKVTEPSVVGYRVHKVKGDRVVLRFKDKSGGGEVPVISDRGEFFPSGRAASKALKLAEAAVGASVSAQPGRGMAGGRAWRYATVAECKARGVVVTGFEAQAAAGLIEIPYQDAFYGVGRPAKAAKKAPRASQDGSGATFYGVRWPDGAVTVRANHGSTWTMTRINETDVPKEILAEAVWIGPRA